MRALQEREPDWEERINQVLDGSRREKQDLTSGCLRWQCRALTCMLIMSAVQTSPQR